MSNFCRVVLFLVALLFSLQATGKAEDGSPPAVVVLSPKAGDLWRAGSRQYILWESTDNRDERPLRLEYSADGGAQWHVIEPATANDGAYLWTVPDVSSTTTLVRLLDADSGTGGSSGSFSISTSQAVNAYRWVKITDNAGFAPRDGAGALVFDNRMWLLGGWNPHDERNFPKDCSNEVWSSRDGALWTLVKPNTFGIDGFDGRADWEGRHSAGYVVFKDKMWIVGGDAIQRHYQYDVWNSADGETWTNVTEGMAVPWGPRVLHYTVVFDDHIWVIGGQTLPQFAPEDELFYDDVWKSPDGVHWQRVPAEGPRWSNRGMIGGTAVFKGRIWILGGGTLNTLIQRNRFMYNDVWSSPDGIRWKRHMARAPWKPRHYHDVAVFDDRLWVLEGWNRENLNDVWYSTDGVNWYEVPDTPWAPRHAASVYVFDDALWVVAGNNMQSDVWKLTRSEQSADRP